MKKNICITLICMFIGLFVRPVFAEVRNTNKYLNGITMESLELQKESMLECSLTLTFPQYLEVIPLVQAASVNANQISLLSKLLISRTFVLNTNELLELNKILEAATPTSKIIMVLGFLDIAITESDVTLKAWKIKVDEFNTEAVALESLIDSKLNE